MCFHDSPIKVASVTYDFNYSLTEVFPGPPAGAMRTDIFTVGISVTLTRVFLKDKGLPPALDSIDTLAAYLNPDEFFLLSDCCCPCKWVFVPKFQDQYAGFATQTRSVPSSGLSGTVTFGTALSFVLTPNNAEYTICGNNVTYAPQSIYWPTFDGVTPRDPAYFDGGISLEFICTAYSGSPDLDPGIGSSYSGGSFASPYDPALGYFLFYANGSPPTPIPGVTGTGHGFRNPCESTMSFEQSVSWSMTYSPNSLTGNGTGDLSVSFNP